MTLPVDCACAADVTVSVARPTSANECVFMGNWVAEGNCDAFLRPGDDGPRAPDRATLALAGSCAIGCATDMPTDPADEIRAALKIADRSLRTAVATSVPS